MVNHRQPLIFCLQSISSPQNSHPSHGTYNYFTHIFHMLDTWHQLMDFFPWNTSQFNTYGHCTATLYLIICFLSPLRYQLSLIKFPGNLHSQWEIHSKTEVSIQEVYKRWKLAWRSVPEINIWVKTRRFGRENSWANSSRKCIWFCVRWLCSSEVMVGEGGQYPQWPCFQRVQMNNLPKVFFLPHLFFNYCIITLFVFPMSLTVFYNYPVCSLLNPLSFILKCKLLESMGLIWIFHHLYPQCQ